MAKEYSPLKLIKNKVYPSYQICTTAVSAKLSGEEILKVCVLETLFWIRQKFENLDMPEELKAPSPSQYDSFNIRDLKTFRIERGYIVDVVYIESRKIWSFQLVEPDLASTVRPPVPGRVFTTDISFVVDNNSVKCAFRTLVSEPENCNEAVISLRNGVIKRLVRNPHLKIYHNSLPLNEKCISLSSEKKISFFVESINESCRTLPLIVFAEYKKDISQKREAKDPIDIHNTLNNSLFRSPFPLQPLSPTKIPDIKFDIKGSKYDNIQVKPEKSSKKKAISKDNFVFETEIGAETDELAYFIYDLNEMASLFMGYAFIYGLAYNKIREFEMLANLEIKPGEVIVIEPNQYGKTIKYKCYENPDEYYQRLLELKNIYHIKKNVDFNDFVFVRDARIIQQKEMLSNYKTIDEMIFARAELTKNLETMRSSVEELNLYKSKSIQLEDKLKLANEKIEKQKQQLLKMEELIEKERNNTARREFLLQIQVDYYHSLDDRPKSPKEVPAWIKKKFPDSIVLHKRAVALLEDLKGLPDGYMKKLCDALEYLGIEYYKYYYSKEITEEMASLYASLKYNQKFAITPSSDASIEYLPNDYMIKYDKNDGKGKRNYPLDIHLKSGTDPKYLIRIYFHYDEVNKKIVIGSLPRHLPTVSQK